MSDRSITETQGNSLGTATKGGAVSGLALPWRALKLVLSNPKLLGLALAPAIAGAAAWFAGTAVFAVWGDDWLAKTFGSPDTLSLLGKFGFYVGWGALVLVAPVIASFLVSRVLAAPVLDLLGERTMKALGRPVRESSLSEYPSIFALAITRFALYVAVSLGLFVANVVPGAAVLVGPAGLAWSGLWIFTDSLQPALDAAGTRGVWPALNLFRRSFAKAAGFTTSAALLSFVPFVGSLVTPLLVVAGALFVAESSEQDPR